MSMLLRWGARETVGVVNLVAIALLTQQWHTPNTDRATRPFQYRALDPSPSIAQPTSLRRTGLTWM